MWRMGLTWLKVAFSIPRSSRAPSVHSPTRSTSSVWCFCRSHWSMASRLPWKRRPGLQRDLQLHTKGIRFLASTLFSRSLSGKEQHSNTLGGWSIWGISAHSVHKGNAHLQVGAEDTPLVTRVEFSSFGMTSQIMSQSTLMNLCKWDYKRYMMNSLGKSADYSGKSIGWQAAWSNFASLIAGLKQTI